MPPVPFLSPCFQIIHPFDHLRIAATTITVFRVPSRIRCRNTLDGKYLASSPSLLLAALVRRHVRPQLDLDLHLRKCQAGDTNRRPKWFMRRQVTFELSFDGQARFVSHGGVVGDDLESVW